MKQPKDFVQPETKKKVCHLLKAIYDLKQAALQWNKVLHKSLLTMKFVQIYGDSDVYIHFYSQNIIILVIYINDALLISSNCFYLLRKKKQFANKWKSCDQGAATEYHSMGITHNYSKQIFKLDQVGPCSAWVETQQVKTTGRSGEVESRYNEHGESLGWS